MTDMQVLIRAQQIFRRESTDKLFVEWADREIEQIISNHAENITNATEKRSKQKDIRKKYQDRDTGGQAR